MRILLLCTDAFGGHGGIALFNRELTRALAAHQRCEQIVVLPRIVPHAPEPLPEKTAFLADGGTGEAAYALALARLARGERFDLVICGHINLLPFARAVARNPLLITHGIEAWRPQRKISNTLIRHCRAVVSVSDLTRTRFLRWSGYTGPTFVLPNAVRAEQYGIRPKNRQLLDQWGLGGRRVLLTVGRIASRERYKGFDEVLEVLPAFADAAYLIAGGGDDLIRLQRKASALGVSDRVAFSGLFPEEIKPDLYNLADVYVMPSRGEGFGFVLLEAMACGLPVVASKHDGGREALLDGKLGTLVDPANPSELRQAIADALDEGKREVPAGLEHFSFANFTRRVHAIVEEVTG
jgi:glycosyltransferase involved in cell wall biosynthesis